MTASRQLNLFNIREIERAKDNMFNSGYVSNDDYELAKETNEKGYDLDRPARVYSVSQGGTIQNLWITSTRDAMRICSHLKSSGVLYGREWMYCWTQHDIDLSLTNGYKDKFKDDGRLKTFKGLEDVKILKYLT